MINLKQMFSAELLRARKRPRVSEENVRASAERLAAWKASSLAAKNEGF